MTTIREQKAADKAWQDEKGVEIPYSRVTSVERKKERSAAKVASEAIKLNESLRKFKELCAEQCEKAYQADLAAGKAPNKGGYTLNNFDRSIKIERSINEAIQFDENLIGAAREKFNSFLEVATGGIDEMIRQLISDAFSSNKKGKLDSKKVMNLLSYRSRISEAKYPAFHEALSLIEESIRRPESKTYYRIFMKADNGEMKPLELNFASI